MNFYTLYNQSNVQDFLFTERYTSEKQINGLSRKTAHRLITLYIRYIFMIR